MDIHHAQIVGHRQHVFRRRWCREGTQGSTDSGREFAVLGGLSKVLVTSHKGDTLAQGVGQAEKGACARSWTQPTVRERGARRIKVRRWSRGLRNQKKIMSQTPREVRDFQDGQSILAPWGWRRSRNTAGCELCLGVQEVVAESPHPLRLAGKGGV